MIIIQILCHQTKVNWNYGSVRFETIFGTEPTHELISHPTIIFLLLVIKITEEGFYDCGPHPVSDLPSSAHLPHLENLSLSLSLSVKETLGKTSPFSNLPAAGGSNSTSPSIFSVHFSDNAITADALPVSSGSELTQLSFLAVSFLSFWLQWELPLRPRAMAVPGRRMRPSTWLARLSARSRFLSDPISGKSSWSCLWISGGRVSVCIKLVSFSVSVCCLYSSNCF